MKRGDIVYVDLPLFSNNHAQGGRRPAVLVIADKATAGNSMAMIVPFTSKLVALRFPHTLKIEPSTQNGLVCESVALVFQLCAADRNRFEQVVGHLEDEHLLKIDEMMRKLLDL